MNAQIIEKDGKPEWAVLPYEEYRRLMEAAEDEALYREAKAAPNEEVVPADVVNRILDGEHPIKVWREYRNLTQDQLASASSLSKPYISQIEAGKRTGTLESLQAIARALDVDLDMIAEHR